METIGRTEALTSTSLPLSERFVLTEVLPRYRAEKMLGLTISVFRVSYKGSRCSVLDLGFRVPMS